MAITSYDDVTPGAAPRGDLLLGQGAEFDGKLTFAGTVRIDSRFKGSIVTNDVLIVGEHARMDAEITCGTVIVDGEVNGNVTAKTAVELHRTARVRGNVVAPQLSIEKGAFFQGDSRTAPPERGASTTNGSSRSVPVPAPASAPASTPH